MIMNPIILFLASVMFILIEYSMYTVSKFIVQYVNMTGKVYWAFLLIIFIILNKIIFGGFIDATLIQDVSEDETEISEWDN